MIAHRYQSSGKHAAHRRERWAEARLDALDALDALEPAWPG